MLPDADHRHVAVAHSRIQQSLLFQIAHDEGIFGQLACQIDFFLVLVYDDEIGVCGVKSARASASPKRPMPMMPYMVFPAFGLRAARVLSDFR